MSCPDGHRWYQCKHKERAHPVLGLILMFVGFMHVSIGVFYLVG